MELQDFKRKLDKHTKGVLDEIEVDSDLDREMDRWFALCKRDKAYRRAFDLLLTNGFGSIKTEMHGRKLKRVIGEVVFVAED